MPARTKARKRALDILYEADLMSLDPMATLRIRLAQADPPVPPIRRRPRRGGRRASRRARPADLLARGGLDLARMPAVDRNVLRLGAFEIALPA